MEKQKQVVPQDILDDADKSFPLLHGLRLSIELKIQEGRKQDYIQGRLDERAYQNKLFEEDCARHEAEH